jgi:hypothetical protein
MKRPRESTPSPRSYSVGKGRPPQEFQWKPGQSGNPTGRTKGAKNAATLAKAALRRKVTGTLNGVRRKMTVLDVSFRRLADKAMSGDQKALNYLLMLAGNFDPADIDSAQTVTAERDFEIIDEFFKRHRRRSSAR